MISMISIKQLAIIRLKQNALKTKKKFYSKHSVYIVVNITDNQTNRLNSGNNALSFIIGISAHRDIKARVKEPKSGLNSIKNSLFFWRKKVEKHTYLAGNRYRRR